MTYIANICETWTQKLEPADDKDSFVNWVLRSPKEVSAHLTAGWHAYRAVANVYSPSQINSAREYFGGMGAQASMIEMMFAPEDHVVMDISRDAVSHMQWQLDSAVAPHVRWGDAYEPGNCFPADLVGLDFGDLTVWKTREGEKHRDLLDRVFDRAPKAVVLTDIAGPRLHLQRARYETLLGDGSCESYDTYLAAFVARLETLYGYTLAMGYQHRWSAVLALVPDSVTPGKVLPTPETPVGLELF